MLRNRFIQSCIMFDFLVQVHHLLHHGTLEGVSLLELCSTGPRRACLV